MQEFIDARSEKESAVVVIRTPMGAPCVNVEESVIRVESDSAMDDGIGNAIDDIEVEGTGRRGRVSGEREENACEYGSEDEDGGYAEESQGAHGIADHVLKMV
jgi:hypothetical protein